MPRGGAASWTGGGPPCPCRSSWLCGLWVGVGIVGVWGVGWVKWRVGICPCEGQQQQQLIAGYLGFWPTFPLPAHDSHARSCRAQKIQWGRALSYIDARSSASPDPPTNYTVPPPSHTQTAAHPSQAMSSSNSMDSPTPVALLHNLLLACNTM